MNKLLQRFLGLFKGVKNLPQDRIVENELTLVEGAPLPNQVLHRH